MAIEAVFGAGLGNLWQSPEATILAGRQRVDVPEFSLLAFARGLCDLLTGLATSSTEFVLSRDGADFYFLLVVRKPTLGLDLPQTVTIPLQRTRRVSPREQMATAAARVACQLADLGTPHWLASEPPGPRRPATLDPMDLI